MKIYGHCEPSARRALWVSGMLVVLAGLFGMHGLDSHGIASMRSMTESSVSESAMNGVSAVQASTSAIAHDAGMVESTAAIATGHPLMDMGMAGMCLAVLAVALIALLRFLGTNRVRPVLWVVARPVRAPGYACRDPDPPSLIDLSIQRC